MCRKDFGEVRRRKVNGDTGEDTKEHEELDEIWSRGVMKGRNPLKEAKVISRMKGSRQVVAAPRGHAKSTNFTFKDSLHAVLYAYKHYILILSDSSEQAEGFLDDIKTELEDNANIIMDFGSLKGDKAWRTGVILTKTDIKAEAIGSGKKVRGRRHRNWRPDLIVLDDIENDENVNTPEQRKKLKNWFDKAVSKAGDTYTDIMYIGTILHYDSLLNNVLQNPRYKTRKYRAVISEAVNTKLWDEWEGIYTNLFNENHEEDARTFYEAHEEEMLLGAEVLWEEKLSYYDLMEIKVSEGTASFNSELQNDPIDPENATFNPEWFDYYEPELMESYGWSLLDFMQGEYDDFMQMEIQQRIRSKLSKREYIDAGSIQTVVKFDGHVYRIRVSFRRNDSNRSYNIDIESDGVEVIVE